MRISLPHNPLLRIGVFARATIELDNSCGVAVPLSALLLTEGPVVQMIRNDRIETRRITIGVPAKNNVQIRDGVIEGDLIVVRAGAFCAKATTSGRWSAAIELVCLLTG